MAKTKIDFKSLEIPAVVQKPLYAGVGAGDLAVAAVKDYVADAQARVTGVQKSVQGFDPKSVRANAISAAKARRSLVEARVADLQAQAQKLPTTVQTVVNENVVTVTGTYADLAKRGEAVVKGTKLPSSASVEVKVNTTNPAATKAAKKPAAKKSPAKKTAAKKAPAKKAAAQKA